MAAMNFLLELAPLFVQENLSLVAFFGILTYVIFLVHWILSTDWEAKFNWCSLIVGLTGLLYLHYSNVLLLLTYEPFFVTVWVSMCVYHLSIWKSNYNKIQQALGSNTIIASLKPFDGSILRYLVTLPTMKNAAGQWNSPPFRNLVHIVLVLLYGSTMCLHLTPFITPLHCNGDISPNCCRYNYVMNKFNTQSVSMSYCSGPVRIGFFGAWSTGKTSIINALLGHSYSTAQVDPAPTTDKFICLAFGSPYSDPIRSDDYEMRKNCDLMSHVNEITHDICGKSQQNVLDVADVNSEFKDFVFFDTPGFQPEYANDCTYQSFYSQIIDQMDFIYVVWDVSHGKIDPQFASFFKDKAHGTDYELIYNRYDEANSNMAFLNQQYSSKMAQGHELLSEGYVLKVHENSKNTEVYAEQYQEDLALLRSRILSVNQTVHDFRKISMKDNLINHRGKVTGLDSLRKVKILDRMVRGGLNIHMKPKQHFLSQFGIEL